MPEDRPTGLTKDAGWQIGARRTLPIEHQEAWQLLISAEGLGLWLGKAAEFELAAGSPYQLEDGTRGEMRVVKPGSHLRLTWQPAGWDRASTLQVRTIAKGDRTVIVFHQEHLPSEASRQDRRQFFHDVLDQLEQRIGSMA